MGVTDLDGSGWSLMALNSHCRVVVDLWRVVVALVVRGLYVLWFVLV